jgi:glycosyltransferase involved in cell wall biosynthesis
MRKKILMVIPNLGLGGAQRAFSDHSVALSKYYDVTEVVFARDSKNLYPSGKQPEVLGVEGGGSLLNKVRNFFRRVTELRRLKDRIRPDICISHLEGADYVNLLSKGPEKVIVLIQGSKSHDINIVGPIGWLRKKVLIPWLYKRADHIVTVSRDIMPEMIYDFGIAPEKVSAINNSFELEAVWQQAQEALSPEMQAVYGSAPILVTSGRLAPQKNYPPLVELFATVNQQQPAKLVFIGDGELRTELIDQARTLGLRVYAAWTDDALTPDYDVYFVGLQHNPFKYIRPATLFVFPSAFEGFPLALGEAMTCGATVMSADCPTGPREMLAPNSQVPAMPIRYTEWAEYGVLLPMLWGTSTIKIDEQQWVGAICTLLNDTAKRKELGRKAQVRAKDFSHASTFARWHELLEAISSD